MGMIEMAQQRAVDKQDAQALRNMVAAKKESDLLNRTAPKDAMVMNEMGLAMKGLAEENAGLKNMFMANQLGTNPGVPTGMYWNQEVAPGITRRDLADAEYGDSREAAIDSIMPEVRTEQDVLNQQYTPNADQMPSGLASSVAAIRG